MTHQARLVLDDCPLALDMLEGETDLGRWRVHWVAAVSLVRSVGYVLKKVDGQDRVVDAVATSRFTAWRGSDPEHEVFREFIEKARNHVLKEYELGIHPAEEIPIVVQTLLQGDAGDPGTLIAEVAVLGGNIYRPLLDGYREGDDARDVLSDAIRWWEAQLDAVDLEVAARRRNGTRT